MFTLHQRRLSYIPQTQRGFARLRVRGESRPSSTRRSRKLDGVSIWET